MSGARLKATPEEPPVTATYFIDEAGTPTLFGHRAKILLPTETSRFFLLGKLDVEDPNRLGQEMQRLCETLLADRYFSDAPSMRPESGKTAHHFHAKDDLPEVRDRVFHLLIEHEVRFSAVVRDKQALLKKVQEMNRVEPTYRYNENEVYDSLVSELFKTAFHQADHFNLVFATRGAKDRTAAFEKALSKAKEIYEQSFGVKSNHTVTITNRPAANDPGLQAVDYFLWALQRLYEKREPRFWSFIWPKVRTVHDLDDQRLNPFGTIYRADQPLTLDVLPPIQ